MILSDAVACERVFKKQNKTEAHEIHTSFAELKCMNDVGHQWNSEKTCVIRYLETEEKNHKGIHRSVDVSTQNMIVSKHFQILFSSSFKFEFFIMQRTGWVNYVNTTIARYKYSIKYKYFRYNCRSIYIAACMYVT